MELHAGKGTAEKTDNNALFTHTNNPHPVIKVHGYDKEPFGKITDRNGGGILKESIFNKDAEHFILQNGAVEILHVH